MFYERPLILVKLGGRLRSNLLTPIDEVIEVAGGWSDLLEAALKLLV